QADDPFTDDVALDLVGAPTQREHAAGEELLAQPTARVARPVPAHAVGTRDLEGDLRLPLAEQSLMELHHGARRARKATAANRVGGVAGQLRPDRRVHVHLADQLPHSRVARGAVGPRQLDEIGRYRAGGWSAVRV